MFRSSGPGRIAAYTIHPSIHFHGLFAALTTGRPGRPPTGQGFTVFYFCVGWVCWDAEGAVLCAVTAGPLGGAQVLQVDGPVQNVLHEGTASCAPAAVGPNARTSARRSAMADHKSSATRIDAPRAHRGFAHHGPAGDGPVPTRGAGCTALHTA
jgi:hypothetical protein